MFGQAPLKEASHGRSTSFGNVKENNNAALLMK